MRQQYRQIGAVKYYRLYIKHIDNVLGTILYTVKRTEPSLKSGEFKTAL
jgi:hypothetical protein